MNKLPFENLKREIIIKKESATSDKFGLSPEKRSIRQIIEYGIININKPSGPTSHQVSAYVRDILKIKKAGHSGTLDPKVTGVLPIALGKATKATQYLLTAGKEYVALMHIHDSVPEEKIRKTVSEFIGKITQLPPLRSAVKREYRERDVYYLEILEIDDQDVLFKVGCQAGTYIRRLIDDIGKRLGTGAHMAELRRTKAGPFDESTSITLQDLRDAFVFYEKGDETELKKIIQPVENAVAHLPKIWVFDTTVDSLCHGASLNLPGISKLESGIKINDYVAIMTLKNELIAIGKAKMTSEEMEKKEKGLAVVLERVFMEPGIYPKINKSEAEDADYS